MYFKKYINIILIFTFIEYNLAYDCLPCTCVTEENIINVICSKKTSQINDQKLINAIPRSIQNFQYYEQIVILNFKGQLFEEIQADVLSKFSNTEKVIFSKNLIRNIHPKCLNNLTLLNTIDLSSNQISSIPTELFQMNRKIQYIFLSNNTIQSLQANLFDNLPELKEIHLNLNHIKYIADNCFVRVSSLNTLDLSTNYLTTLSTTFTDNHDNLTYVYLDKNPWQCDAKLCDIINVSLKKHWFHGRIPQCNQTLRYWDQLQILEPIKILQFQSNAVKVNENLSISCEIHSCAENQILSLQFNNSFLENSTNCIQNYKHTLTSKLSGVTKDDEGLYTCSVKHCTFCANSSGYLEVVDDVMETTEIMVIENVTTSNDQVKNAGIDTSIKAPDINLICLPCIICLIIGIIIGVIIGIIIGILIMFFCIPCCLTLLCCKKIKDLFIKQLSATLEKLKEEVGGRGGEMELQELNSTNRDPLLE